MKDKLLCEMFTFIVRTERNIKKLITNVSREQLRRVSRNVIRSCEVLFRSCRLAIRNSCMKEKLSVTSRKM